MSRTQWKRLAGVLGVVLVTVTVGAAVLVASGDLTVVSTHGVSMEPTYHQGDLVMVRSSDYEIGDVVAYAGDSGETILHRVIDRDGDRLVLQGDNNDWIDPDRPRTSEVIGEAWLHVPGGGRTIAWLRGPLPASAMLAAVGMMLTRNAPGDERTSSWRRLRHRATPRLPRRDRLDGRRAGAGGTGLGRVGPDAAHGPAQGPPPRPAPAPTPAPSAPRRPGHRSDADLHARTVLGGALVALVAAGLLGALAASRPLQREATRRIPFEHTGELSYRAAAPVGPVYENDEIRTGDPLFLDLVDRMQVDFAYRLDPGELRDVTGRAALEVELRAGNGWRRSFPLGAGAEFTGNEVDLSATLDLAELQLLLEQVEDAIGRPGGGYTVSLVPSVSITAAADGAGTTDEYEARHEFRLDDAQLRPAAAEVDEAADGTPVLRDTRAGTATTRELTDETISALGRHMTVGTARWFAGVTGAVAGVLALSALVVLLVRGPRTTADRISARYGRRMIEVDGGEGGDSRTIIDVSTIGALVRLADHHDRLILHHRSESGDTFMVDAGDTLYRHRVAPAPHQLGR